MDTMTVKQKQKFDINRFKNRYLSIKFASETSWKIIRFVLVFGISFMILYPFIVKILCAFMDPEDFIDPTVRFIPKNPTLYFIKRAFKSMDYMVTARNSLILSLVTGLLQVAVCIIVGYGLARFKFKGRNLIFALVMLTMLVPPQTIMISLFMRFRFFGFMGFTFNLIDTYWPFILLSATGLGLKNGLYIYLMRQFFRGMPKELEEAAYIDGSGPFRTFATIMVPNAVPMMLTVFLFSFSWQWTDVFYSSLFFHNMNVLSVVIETISQLSYEDPVIFSTLRNTACMMIILPLLLIYVFAQRYFIQGIERSGIVS